MMDHLLQMPKIILALGFIRYIKPISELFFFICKKSQIQLDQFEKSTNDDTADLTLKQL